MTSQTGAKSNHGDIFRFLGEDNFSVLDKTLVESNLPDEGGEVRMGLGVSNLASKVGQIGSK